MSSLLHLHRRRVVPAPRTFGKRGLTWALAALLPVAVACGTASSGSGSGSAGAAAPPQTPPASAQQVTGRALDTMRFEPSSLTVRTGEPVTLTFDNAGRMPHDFTLTQGVSRRVQAVADGGQRATVTFTLEQPGTYSFVCSVPGHEAAGMKGTITAQ